MIFDRVLFILWAIIIAFFCVSWLGTTNILSQIFSVSYINTIVDILFFFLCALFSGILWCILPQPISLQMKLAASLPLILVLLFIIVF
ncbi:MULTISPECIES: hypothetical protein [unclassified Bartonella]|uniref:hypothetical protein n=1 Tax=unclassified Bartonella TaxID=2645622 RepID=UPI00099AE3E4|nr:MULTISPECIES: hypothetical protein [unclassified Bartonella]AQX27821.1 hypothetical protein BJB15x_004090 [Bartonella sp. JB15]AQX29103.1 hypothetical protein BJB63x_004090 [Bartonella sp. JB63]